MNPGKPGTLLLDPNGEARRRSEISNCRLGEASNSQLKNPARPRDHLPMGLSSYLVAHPPIMDTLTERWVEYRIATLLIRV